MRALISRSLSGIGLLETTALSVGRGTDTPFEVIGAPYINRPGVRQSAHDAALPAGFICARAFLHRVPACTKVPTAVA